MNLLTSLFYLNIEESNSQLKTFVKRFTKCSIANKESLKRIFYTVDKLYTLSQILNS